MKWKKQDFMMCILPHTGTLGVPEMASNTALLAWPDEVETQGYGNIPVKLHLSFHSGNKHMVHKTQYVRHLSF